MRRLLSVIGALLVASLALAAQAPTAVPPAPVKAPAPSELETAWIQIAALTQQLGSCQSAQLDSVKQANAVYADVLGRIEHAHPGYTVDWKSGALVAKAIEKK